MVSDCTVQLCQYQKKRQVYLWWFLFLFGLLLTLVLLWSCPTTHSFGLRSAAFAQISRLLGRFSWLACFLFHPKSGDSLASLEERATRAGARLF